jgi:hypothetical protein
MESVSELYGQKLYVRQKIHTKCGLTIVIQDETKYVA